MTAPDPGRRRVLAILGAGVAAAALGAVAWWRGDGAPPATTQPAGMAVPPATTTTAPPSSTTTIAATTTTTAPPGTTISAKNAAGTVITVIGREGWGARPSGGGLVEHLVERITVHHTATLLEENSEAPSHLRGHQAFHVDTRGWPDLAYHFVIDAAGNVYQGRDPAVRGDTATDYDPTGHLLVCCEGDFDRQPLPDPQRTSLETMLAWAVAEYAVTVDTIAGHGDQAATSCPGDALRTLIHDGTLAEAVGARTAEAPRTVEILTGRRAVAAVAAIEAGR